ncbi:MAG TPA: hypothetical protein VMR21_01145, partial [Vicinamibacteria bacterium]|nr:hypothetical protein [Vicinamibacteria bacterium]
MNLLVTNTHAPQAYAVVRALRPHAARIVATVEGTGPRASVAAHAARSRLVDRRCPVPSPAADWAAGRISRENTPAEARYVEALERICREEHIDAIYPSWDPHVYVLAKNRERFAAQGVVVPVPDLDVVLTALDKHLTV